ncbi:MAG: DsrE/DsrF/DrsH-like family protein [Caldilineales bacterium]|nr:DsrE/DsrF/DrsH-like family protein [Caldilineales bacterium]
MAIAIEPNVSDVLALHDRLAALEARIAELEEQIPDDKITLIVFSGDLDRVLAAFVIATGALAMGQEVAMFFTFWGLTTLKKQRILDGKTLPEKMMSLMTPASTKGMGTSKMNFFGAGSVMLRQMMAAKNVESVESLIDLCQEMGVKMVSCEMSRDVMGIASEELRDGVEVGGAGAMLADALRSRATFFI